MALLLKADARHIPLQDESVHCVVTSPPYWGLRDYGLEPQVWGGDPGCIHIWDERKWYTEQSAGRASCEAFSKAGESNADRLKKARWRTDSICQCGAWRGCLGLEPTPELYVQHLVEIFREVHRVLRKKGTLWLDLGDCFNSNPSGPNPGGFQGKQMKESTAYDLANPKFCRDNGPKTAKAKCESNGLKPKDLVGIPWMVAFALRADGWYLRSDIIWHKPNPRPESVTDRPTRSHEYIFLLTKSARYYYDAAAIKEPGIYAGPNGAGTQKTPYGQGFARRTAEQERRRQDKQRGHSRRHAGFNERWDRMSKEEQCSVMRNKRSVWTIATQPFPGSHFATFPEKLIEPCILAGCPQGGIVLDPFVGSGTTVRVATRLNRIGIGLDLAYHDIAKKRLAAVQVRLPLGDGAMYKDQ